MKTENLPEKLRSEKIIEDCEDNDHEKSNGNLIIENINQNNQVNNVDLKIFQFLNKMKQNKNENSYDDATNKSQENNNVDGNNNDRINRSSDSLDNLIIKNQKELISSNNYNYNNNNSNSLNKIPNSSVGKHSVNLDSKNINYDYYKYNDNNNIPVNNDKNNINEVVVIEEKHQVGDKKNNFTNNKNVNNSLNKSASCRNIKLKIDGNDDIIVEDGF